MEVQHYDAELKKYVQRGARPKPRIYVRRPVTGGLPETITADGAIMVKTDTGLSQDNIFGLSKKEKERKAAKKEAKAEAKAAGKSKKEIRVAGRNAKQDVKAAQLQQKAASKAAKGNVKAAARIKKKAVRVSERDGKTAVGIGVKKIAKAISLAPLVPLMPVMGNALKKKGFNPPSKVADRAELFYNEVVRKDTFEREQHFDGYNDDHIAGEIVEAVISFVKGVFQKKKQQAKGEPIELSPVQELIAKQSAPILADIERKAIDAGVEMDERILNAMPGSNSRDSSEAGEMDGQMSRSEESSGRKREKDNTMLYLGIGAVVVGAIILKS